MMARRLLIVLAAGLVAAVALTLPASDAASAARDGKHACGKLRPAKLSFTRARGKTVGTLRWRSPKDVRAKRRSPKDVRAKRRSPAARGKSLRPRASRSHRTTYRVFRNRRVVGQTAKRSMRVRVSLGRRYRFAVIPLRPDGRRTRCGRSKRMRIAYRRPGRPRHLGVSGDERGLRLTWRRARRGDAKVAGYRVLRDGETLGQRPGTSWELPVALNRRYRFTVVAVDRRGRVSRPSNDVTAVASHEPPTTPSGLHLTSTSESSIDAAWQPSSVKSGRIVGYRVLRDDTVVGQADATARRLDNLAPSTDYRVSVVAVDNYGYVSAPATASARTRDPVPTTGHAHAYMLASTDSSFADFRAHYQQIGVIHPTYYDCTGAAALVGNEVPLITQWAQARKVQVLPRINCQRKAVVSRILTDPATRARWLDLLVQLARDVGYDGISIDFEAGPPEDRDALTSFIQELSRRLHADGRLLAMAVSPKVRDIPDHSRSGIFDYPKLAQAADYLFLMAWGLHWSTSVPGAQDDLTWVRQVVAYVATLPERHKFIYGTNLYALDWPNGGGPENTATAYEYQDIVPFLPGLGATIRLDPETDNYHATYTDAAGVPRDVWYSDAVTTARRLSIAKDAGLGGVGFWRLGREDQRVWENPLIAPGVAW